MVSGTCSSFHKAESLHNEQSVASQLLCVPTFSIELQIISEARAQHSHCSSASFLPHALACSAHGQSRPCHEPLPGMLSHATQTSLVAH
jgi:hypothetical protein